MIEAENEFGSVKVILELAHHVLRYQSLGTVHQPPGRFDFQDQAIDSLCELFPEPDLRKRVRGFCAEHNEPARQAIVSEIAKAV